MSDSVRDTVRGRKKKNKLRGWEKNGNVRYGPSTSYGINYTVAAGFTSYGLCWRTEGGHVSANGISHNKWVKLDDNAWIWGGLLQGNETGGVANHC
ncbi:hypothetical protein [Streptomyces sp. MA15]|uniref:hypothetical protein n=1 Tax=Streptomyces sp. MA15 TaxID=3055061 RepID=UPI0025B17BC6|nr:hypothetical protein [Streptomyces sp. MA15]MDN3271955.1 hypothetical protein [Streptomyces sp. MA15]